VARIGARRGDARTERRARGILLVERDRVFAVEDDRARRKLGDLLAFPFVAGRNEEDRAALTRWTSNP
jgi:hypothetical protein